MKDLLDFIIRALVTHPEEVKIEEEASGDDVRFSVQVAQDDLGRIIGKKGRTAKSLRQVMSAAATLKRQRVAVRFVE